MGTAVTILVLVILFSLIGAFFGIITGLIPGLHVNNLSIILLSLSGAIMAGMTSLLGDQLGVVFISVLLAAIVVSISISHTFHDFIPSTFLGAPDPDTALNVLPAHEMLLDGKGYEAVRLSAMGSMGAIMVAVLFIIPFRLIIGDPVMGYSYLKKYMIYVLVSIFVILIITETREVKYGPGDGKKKSRALGIVLALVVFVIAGTFGYTVLSMDYYKPFFWPAPWILPSSMMPPAVLFPMLSGIFGLSTLIDSLSADESAPPQVITRPEAPIKSTASSIFSGTLAGSVVGFLPGMTSGIATIMAMIARKDTEKKQVIVTLSAINTANSLFVLVALFLILRPRSGAAIVINQLISVEHWDALLLPESLSYLLIAVLVAATTAFLTTCAIGKFAAKHFHRVSYKAMVKGIIVFIVVMVFVFTGWVGLFILAVGTIIGMLPIRLGVRRSHAMGCLLLPVILLIMNV